MASPRRIASVDIVRGLVMGLMMIDHVRETFYLHRQVADPVDLRDAGLALFFMRAASHICAPAFVLLAGLAAALRRDRRGDGAAATAGYLVRRGLLLILLELTVVNFAWTFPYIQPVLYLQVIWAIGLSMIALAGLIYLPAGPLLAASLAIIFGHNLLDPVAPPAGPVGRFAWAILHARTWFAPSDGFRFRVSYPVLPYIGVIGLGYSLGRLYVEGVTPRARRATLAAAGAACIGLFLALRPVNLYGERGRLLLGDSTLATLASLVNTTKYPPSLLFLMMTLGPTLILLAVAERARGPAADAVARFGAAPMVFYVLHLLFLHAVNFAVARATGTPGLYHFDRIEAAWAATVGSLVIVCPLTLRVADRLKRVGKPAVPAAAARSEGAIPW